MKEIGQKLAKITLFLWLLFIPVQLGKHFWPNWSFVLGIRIDYLSPTLYLVDLLWIGLVVFSFKFSILKKRIFSFRNFWIFIFVLVNILLAQNRMVAIYGWLRIFQLVWTVWFLKNNKDLVKSYLKYIIPTWIIVESLLAIGQISKGGSLGGWWWWLGERTFNFNTIGIAQMSVIGNGLVRAYGTFSHPNSLAGFLLVSWIWWWKTKPLSPDKSGQLPLKKGAVLKANTIFDVFWWMVFWLGLIGIILTGSRTIWLLTGLSLVFFIRKFFGENKNWIKIMISLVLILILAIKIIDFNYPIKNFLDGWDENGLIKRGQLNLASLEMIKNSPVFGIGMKNFLVNLPNFQNESHFFWLQPVHNILLLTLSEIGFLGLGILVWGLSGLFRNKKLNKEDWLIIGIILVSGMVDHYWLTLPQNMWLMALAFGLI